MTTANKCTFSGEIAKFGVTGPKGGNWGKLWILVNLNPIAYTVQENNINIQNNTVFINIDVTFDDSSKGKKSKYIINALEENSSPFIFVRDAFLAQIKRSRKDDKGNWEDFVETGIRASIFNINLSGYRYPVMNFTESVGKVIAQEDYKVVIEDNYRSPKENVVKSRPVPVIVPDKLSDNLLGKYIYLDGKLCGKNSKNESKPHVVANNIIVI